MPVYMCRWHSGDISFVSAASQEDAIFTLDKLGNDETCPMFKVPDGMVPRTRLFGGVIALG